MKFQRFQTEHGEIWVNPNAVRFISEYNGAAVLHFDESHSRTVQVAPSKAADALSDRN